MRATVFRGPFDVRVEQVRDAALQEPTDALVRITHACICGSDLWPYRGLEPFPPGGRLGHEWMGMVEEVGSMVSTIKRGDRVIAPFAFSDGTCEFCHKGLYTNCLHGGVWGQANDGGQAEAIRAPFADSTLVVVPKSVEGDEALLKAILPLTDVMGTGHYAAVLAGVHAGERWPSSAMGPWAYVGCWPHDAWEPNASFCWVIKPSAWNWHAVWAQPTSSRVAASRPSG